MQFKTSMLTLAVGSALMSTASVQAIQITDYVEPESTYEEAYVSGRLSTKSGNQDKTSFDTSISADYEKNYSSREHNFNIRGDGFYAAERGGNEEDSTDSTYNLNATFLADNYFQPNMFWYGGADSSYNDVADEAYLAISGGVGYGRVTNATPLARAIRVVEELQQHNIIGDSVSDEAYMKLAQIINREDEFRSKYGAEEYQAEFMAALEEAMKETGLAPNGIGAGGAAHLGRVLYDERISVRKYGWLVRAGAGVVVNDFDGESGDPLAEAAFEYALPLNVNSQFIERAGYSAIFKDGDRTNQVFTNEMSYTHELTDEIDWENSWTMTYVFADSDAEKDTMTNKLSSTFRYYLTNTLALDATVALSRVNDDIDGNGNDETDITTFLGVTYRLK